MTRFQTLSLPDNPVITTEELRTLSWAANRVAPCTNLKSTLFSDAHDAGAFGILVDLREANVVGPYSKCMGFIVDVSHYPYKIVRIMQCEDFQNVDEVVQLFPKGIKIFGTRTGSASWKYVPEVIRKYVDLCQCLEELT